jgi:spore coat protein A
MSEGRVLARSARGASVLVSLAVAAVASAQPAQTPLDGASIPKFVDPLPTFAGQRVGGPVVYVAMKETQQQVLPAGYGYAPTTVWGYEVGGIDVTTGRPVLRPARFPGVTVEALQGTPTHVVYSNRLTTPTLQSQLPVDQTIHWADPLKLRCIFQPSMSPDCMRQYAGPVPTVVHLHGGEVPPAFDGGPEAWFTASGEHGSNYSSLVPVLPNQALYRYPNTQEATALWFHDHALGTTRLNVYGGIAAFYFLRDDQDTGKGSNPLRLPAGEQEIELALQDRSFDIAGQLLYYDATQLPNPQIHPFWRPEFFGDVIVVNGKSWPTLAVEPRRYRFRFLNGSNARFYDMAFAKGFTGDPALGGSLGMIVTDPGPAFWQIGTDGGRLDAPVRIDRLLVAPGERADVIVDFSGLAGQTFTLVNGANAPFPDGDPVGTSTTGQIMQITVSKRLSSPDGTCNPAAGGCTLRRTPIVRLADPAKGTLARGVTPTVKRQLILKEIAADPIPAGCDPGAAPGDPSACLTTGGPREVLLNNTLWSGVTEQTLTDPSPTPVSGGSKLGANFATEAPRVGSTEVWEVANLTVDAHPIHVHLIQFQVLNRQAMNTGEDDAGAPFGYMADWQAAFAGGALVEGGGPPLPYGDPANPATWNADGAVGGNLPFSPYLSGAATPPTPGEAGWKDTVVMYPGTVTRIAVRWAPQGAGVQQAKPGRNLFPFDPTLTDPKSHDLFGNPGAAGYVWHCHILEHEDDEMMRPYAVQR